MKKNKEICKISIIKNPVHFLAFGLGTGFAPIAPGTVGTFLGVIIYIVNNYYLLINELLLIIISTLIGIYICGKTAHDIDCHDHQGIVWDEVTGFFITMFLVPFNAVNIMLGFILFRFFDIIKPWPIKQIDRKVSGGLGIMLDDVLAGIFANISINLILYCL
jgi:phosphatidylglycerophosphatase A